MPTIEIPITGGFYESRSLPISSQQCKNCYVHVNDGGGMVPESLFGIPGLNQLATAGTTTAFINRGAHVMAGKPYFVQDNTLYRMDRTISGTGVETFNLVNLGSISGTGRVSMADNGTQLLILVPGGTGYIWNGSTLATISDPDFTANGNPQHVVFIDGYFLLTTDTKKFIISNLNDGTAYTATDFGSAEADPDDIVAPIVLNNSLYIAGGETIELFRNAAAQTGAAFPFLRVEGGTIGTGVRAAFSVVEAQNTVFFVGGDTNSQPMIYAFDGGSVQAVSTDGINYALEQLTDTQVSNIFAWTYTELGESFVGFVLPNTVLVYGLKSGRWHERKSYDVVDDVGSEFRWRVNSIVQAYGRLLVGDSLDGRIGEMGIDILSEYGQESILQVSTMPFSNLGSRLLVPYVEMTAESGVGNSDDPDPVISMQFSKDGGRTWSENRERRVGKIGQYRNRSIWRRNGRFANDVCFRWTMAGKVKKVLIKAEADIR